MAWRDCARRDRPAGRYLVGGPSKRFALAANAGLRAGDPIIKVGSVALADRPESEGRDLIRGPVGTTVEITFLRDGSEHVVSLERASIVVPVASWQMVTYHHLRIGHLTFTRFTEGSGDKLRAEVRAALHDGAQGLILDMRGNGGGLVSEAINIASIFIPKGEIMSAEERGSSRRVYMALDDAIAAHIPLVVLVRPRHRVRSRNRHRGATGSRPG